MGTMVVEVTPDKSGCISTPAEGGSNGVVTAAGDRFGYSVSLSADGTILAVGAILANGVNGVVSGRVHVYQWISYTSWQPLGSDNKLVTHPKLL